MRCTERCPECPSRNLKDGQKEKPVVSGDWNHGPHRIVFVGEAPSKEENNRQRVFVGKPGEEFNNTYLPLAGLTRSEVSMTNSVKCHWADSSDAPPPELVKSCSEFHLRRELAYHNPDYVVLMGGTANSLLDYDVELEHGMVHHDVQLLGWRGTVFSTFHPALGLHKSDKMLAMVDRLDGDFPRLKRLLKGELEELHDDCPTEFRRLRQGKETRRLLSQALSRGCDLAVDTESRKSWRGFASTIRYTPYCATFACWTGEAFMVHVGDESFEALAELINRFNRIIFHNAAYDHEILRLAGCRVDWSRTRDTMAMAYDEGRLPKGLKPLSYRLLGKRMRSFDDVVVPHGWNRAVDYLVSATMIDWPKPIQEPTGDMVWRNCPDCKGKGTLSIGRGKMRRVYDCGCSVVDGDGIIHTGKLLVPRMTRKQSLNDKIGRLATDVRKKGMGVDLWKRWEAWTESDPIGIRHMIDTIGPIPLPSIEFVPEDEAIEYACGDAHETLRIFPILQQRLVDIRRSHNA